MPVYLVRLLKSREVVGIFSAKDGEGLSEVLSEHLDPGHVEYVSMPKGGVYVRATTAAQWPARLLDEGGEQERAADDDQHPLAGGELLESWDKAARRRKWTRLRGDPIDAAVMAANRN